MFYKMLVAFCGLIAATLSPSFASNMKTALIVGEIQQGKTTLLNSLLQYFDNGSESFHEVGDGFFSHTNAVSIVKLSDSFQAIDTPAFEDNEIYITRELKSIGEISCIILVISMYTQLSSSTRGVIKFIEEFFSTTEAPIFVVHSRCDYFKFDTIRQEQRKKIIGSILQGLHNRVEHFFGNMSGWEDMPCKRFQEQHENERKKFLNELVEQISTCGAYSTHKLLLLKPIACQKFDRLIIGMTLGIFIGIEQAKEFLQNEQERYKKKIATCGGELSIFSQEKQELLDDLEKLDDVQRMADLKERISELQQKINREQNVLDKRQKKILDLDRASEKLTVSEAKTEKLIKSLVHIINNKYIAVDDYTSTYGALKTLTQESIYDFLEILCVRYNLPLWSQRF